MEFSRQEYWSALPFPSPAYLPDPGIKAGFPSLQQILHHLSHQGSPQPVHSQVVMDPRLRPLMAETQDTNPLWSPDGKRAAASRGVQGSLGAPTCTVCSQPTSMWLCGTTNTLSRGSEGAPRGHIRPNCRSRGSQPRGSISSASTGAGGRLAACRACLLPADGAGRRPGVTPTQRLSPERCRRGPSLTALQHSAPSGVS